MSNTPEDENQWKVVAGALAYEGRIYVPAAKAYLITIRYMIAIEADTSQPTTIRSEAEWQRKVESR
jgi:hypothetical protein